MNRTERIAERTRDLLDELVSVELHPTNLDPYPGTIGDVADEIARFVLELDAGPARGLHREVINRLNTEWARRNRVTLPIISARHLDADVVAEAHRDGRDCGRILCGACRRGCSDLT